MSTATATAPQKIWTEEDLLAMPDDGIERWIIGGKLREKPSEFPEAKMTVRNRHHCGIMSAVVTTVMIWLRKQPKPRGEVYCGEVGVRLPGSFATVGVDVAYAPAAVVAVQDDEKTTLLDGVPTLTVEILSPNDYQEQIHEKTREYLRAGVAIVWVIDPDDQTVKVYRSGQPVESFNITHRLPEHPAMPGFAPTVAELFE
ncbi:MAG TPA: Uma2 family endonuclease [Urbifossiella sp.]|jgi:Uma2 family endonuclease